MPIPAGAVIADLTKAGPGVSNPGYASMANLGFANGDQVPSLVQTIPANPNADPNKWTRIWFTDPKYQLEKVTLFKLAPGPNTFDPELYGEMPHDATNRVVLPKNIKQQWVRVYFDSRADNETAEKQLAVGTLRRWCGGVTSTTYIDAIAGTQEPQFCMAFEIWSDAIYDWSLDTRIPKFQNSLKLHAGRLDIG